MNPVRPQNTPESPTLLNDLKAEVSAESAPLLHDLCLPYPKGLYCGMYIEMKFGDNRQQTTQKEFLEDMAAVGHFVVTCYSAEEAVKVLEEYLNLSDWKHMEKKRRMSIPNNSILKNGEIKESKPRKK